MVLQTAGASHDLVRFGFDATNALVTMAGAGFGASVLAAGIAGSRNGALPHWCVLSSLIIGPLQLLTLGGLAATNGFFAPGDSLAKIAFFALSAWVMAVSLLMMRRP